jgi:catechol 2,3-dioxygenase-like lactoylglutathione lyase family enzyme
MARVLERGATLRLELFTSDLRASLEFYERVLGFEKEAERPGGYAPLSKGSARIALNLRSDLHEDHPIQLAAHERPGRGVEIVLEVDDVEAMYQHVVSQNWPRSAELRRQPWH